MARLSFGEPAWCVRENLADGDPTDLTTVGPSPAKGDGPTVVMFAAYLPAHLPPVLHARNEAPALLCQQRRTLQRNSIAAT